MCLLAFPPHAALGPRQQAPHLLRLLLLLLLEEECEREEREELLLECERDLRGQWQKVVMAGRAEPPARPPQTLGC